MYTSKAVDLIHYQFRCVSSLATLLGKECKSINATSAVLLIMKSFNLLESMLIILLHLTSRIECAVHIEDRREMSSTVCHYVSTLC